MHNFHNILLITEEEKKQGQQKKKSIRTSNWPFSTYFFFLSQLRTSGNGPLFWGLRSPNEYVELCLMIIMMIWQEVVKTNSLTRISLSLSSHSILFFGAARRKEKEPFLFPGDGCLFKQSDSLTSTTPIYFIFKFLEGFLLGKSSTWFNSHIDIICSFFPTHT